MFEFHADRGGTRHLCQLLKLETDFRSGIPPSSNRYAASRCSIRRLLGSAARIGSRCPGSQRFTRQCTEKYEDAPSAEYFLIVKALLREKELTLHDGFKERAQSVVR